MAVDFDKVNSYLKGIEEKIQPRDNTRVNNKLEPKLKKEENKLPDNRTYLSQAPSKEITDANKLNHTLKQIQNFGESLKQVGLDLRDYAAMGTSVLNPIAGVVLGLGDAGISTINGDYIIGGIQAGMEMLPYGISKISKSVKQVAKNIPNNDTEKVIKPTVNAYKDLKTPNIKTPEEKKAIREYVETSFPFKLDYSSKDNFYNSFIKIKGIKPEDFNDPAKSWIKRQADYIYDNYEKYINALDQTIQRTKGDNFTIIRHTNENIPTDVIYTPNRQLSFSFPEGTKRFGNNRLFVDVPEKQSYLASGKVIDLFDSENEVILPSKLKFKIKELGKNDFGGKDYTGKILNPYLTLPALPAFIYNLKSKNNEFHK